MVQIGQIKPGLIPTSSQIANILTKELDSRLFSRVNLQAYSFLHSILSGNRN